MSKDRHVAMQKYVKNRCFIYNSVQLKKKKNRQNQIQSSSTFVLCHCIVLAAPLLKMTVLGPWCRPVEDGFPDTASGSLHESWGSQLSWWLWSCLWLWHVVALLAWWALWRLCPSEFCFILTFQSESSSLLNFFFYFLFFVVAIPFRGDMALPSQSLVLLRLDAVSAIP